MKTPIATLLLAALILSPASAGSPRVPLLAVVPAGFNDATFVTGLTLPVAMEFAPDGRLFVCEKNGALRVVSAAGVLLPAPFLTLAVETLGERGLLGVTFDPQFGSNHFVYCYYTVPGATVHNRVSRFTANGDVVVAGSEVPLLDLDDLQTPYHNGGALHFGADGCLYVAVGENGINSNAQILSNRLGKMLRINADGSIPNDNASSFAQIAGTTAGLNRAIWAVGLRNPFTFAIQPGTGRMFINDVGNATWEEVNDGIAGSNYGWPHTEGDFSTVTFPGLRRPIHTYNHDGVTQGPDNGEAICGGVFYPAGGAFPASYQGKYFFADLTNNWIRYLDPATNATTLFATGLTNTVDLRVGPDGALYYLSHTGNRIGRITYVPVGTAPSITLAPANQTVGAGQSVQFMVSASGTAPLSYQWQRNLADISGATSATYSIASTVLGDNGAQFRCVVTNGFGGASSTAATLTVTSNQAPLATLTNPPAGATYTAGDVIVYAGTGSDPEDGTLPAGSLTWWVDFHHNIHYHPFIPAASGAAGGSFTIPTSGEIDSDVFYRIHFQVQDSGGLMNETYVDIVPVVAHVTLETNPPGLQMTLDGTPQTGPSSFDGVAGMVRSLEAVSPQTLNGTTYTFVSWSSGASAAHTIATPSTMTTYTATFQLATAAPAPPSAGGGGGGCGLLGLEALVVLLLFRRRR